MSIKRGIFFFTALVVVLATIGAVNVGPYPAKFENLIIGGGHTNADGGASIDSKGNAIFTGDVDVQGTFSAGSGGGGSEFSTEAELEALLTDVTNVYTNNDGTFLTSADIDTEAEIEALVTDVTNFWTNNDGTPLWSTMDTEAELESQLTDVTNVFTNNDSTFAIAGSTMTLDPSGSGKFVIAGPGSEMEGSGGTFTLRNTRAPGSNSVNFNAEMQNGTPAYIAYGGWYILATDNTPLSEDSNAKIGLRSNGSLIDAFVFHNTGAIVTSTGTVIQSGHTFTGGVTGTLDNDGSTALTVVKPTPIFFSARSAEPTATAGAAAPAKDANNRYVVSFGKDEFCEWTSLPIPSDFDGSIENITVTWYMSSATEAVTWSVAVRVFADGTAENTAYGSENSASSDTAGAVDQRQRTTISASSLLGASSNANKQFDLRLKATTAAGAFTNEPQLVAVSMEY